MPIAIRTESGGQTLWRSYWYTPHLIYVSSLRFLLALNFVFSKTKMFNFLFILFVIKQLLGKVASNIDIYTAQKMTFSIKDFFSKCDQIWMPNLRDRLQISLLLLNKFNSFTTEAVIIKKPVHWICSHLLKKSLMENVIFCAVLFTQANHYPTRGSWVVVIHMETLHRHFPNSNLMTPSKKKE